MYVVFRSEHAGDYHFVHLFEDKDGPEVVNYFDTFTEKNVLVPQAMNHYNLWQDIRDAITPDRVEDGRRFSATVSGTIDGTGVAILHHAAAAYTAAQRGEDGYNEVYAAFLKIAALSEQYTSRHAKLDADRHTGRRDREADENVDRIHGVFDEAVAASGGALYRYGNTLCRNGFTCERRDVLAVASVWDMSDGDIRNLIAQRG
jgi:hypothetical protein